LFPHGHRPSARHHDATRRLWRHRSAGVGWVSSDPLGLLSFYSPAILEHRVANIRRAVSTASKIGELRPAGDWMVVAFPAIVRRRRHPCRPRCTQCRTPARAGYIWIQRASFRSLMGGELARKRIRQLGFRLSAFNLWATDAVGLAKSPASTAIWSSQLGRVDEAVKSAETAKQLDRDQSAETIIPPIRAVSRRMRTTQTVITTDYYLQCTRLKPRFDHCPS
jgi:hypothetical protein